MPALFDEVAIYFSDEEWEVLTEPQKALYREVMRMNYETVLSLGKGSCPRLLGVLSPENGRRVPGLAEPTSLSPELALCAHLTPRVGLRQGVSIMSFYSVTCAALRTDGPHSKKNADVTSEMSAQVWASSSLLPASGAWGHAPGSLAAPSLDRQAAECHCRGPPVGRFARSLPAKGHRFRGRQGWLLSAEP